MSRRFLVAGLDGWCWCHSLGWGTLEEEDVGRKGEKEWILFREVEFEALLNIQEHI